MGHARVSFLDVRDIARAAARILVSPQDHAGKAYELNGPEAVTYAELAERITRISGRPAAYVDIPPAAQSEAVAQMGMPAWQVDALLGLQRYYTNGQGGELTPVLSTLIGRSPITLDAFLLENRASFLGENQGETPSTDMTFAEMKQFVRDHFEEFVNRKNLAIADVNFAPEFVDHGADVPPGLPPGPAGAKAYLAGAFEKFPDIHVAILDLIAEADKVVVRNRWTATEASTGTKLAFEGIVIWRVAHRQLVERWAYLTPPKPVAS
jgi:predicted SnoaL-like aldol condensation-catalyzing enzyme